MDLMISYPVTCFSLDMPLLKKTSVWMEDGETKVNFSISNGMDAPLGIMVPKHFVPVVEWLGCKKG
jgi:hypothetical protein